MQKSSASCRQKTKTSVYNRRFSSKALHLAQSVYLSLGGPVSLRLLSASLRGDVLTCVKDRIDPSSYVDPGAFRDDYLAVSLLQKADFFDLGVNRELSALQKFLSVESECAATSKRLRQANVNGLISAITPESVMLLARKKIADLVGPFSWDKAELHFRFGPGATTSVPHRWGDAYYKWRQKPSTTKACAILAYTALHRIPRWYQHVVSLTGVEPSRFEELSIPEKVDLLFEIVPGNRVTFVPKDALKDRTIAIEPTMNGFIQHGIGKLLRSCLRRARVSPGGERIDLDDQSLNQRLAEEASVDGSLATLDLSSASDSVSWELVKLLFPADWVEAFSLTRSPSGVLPDGSVVNYHKVSSMGNGYTFELESVIFWALCRACVSVLNLSDRRVSVYGDDLIVPVGAVPTVRWMLGYWGFNLNAEKSYWTGWFRESCGKHFFRGLDVTPIYIRKDVDAVPRLFWFANQIKRWSRLAWGLDSRLKPTYDLAVNFLPRSLREPSIPEGVGDLGLIGDLDEVLPRRSPNHLDSWSVEVRVPVIATRTFSDIPFLLRTLGPKADSEYSIYRPLKLLSHGFVFRSGTDVRYLTSSSGVSIRGQTPSWKRVTVSVPNWPCFGPWLDLN